MVPFFVRLWYDVGIQRHVILNHVQRNSVFAWAPGETKTAGELLE